MTHSNCRCVTKSFRVNIRNVALCKFGTASSSVVLFDETIVRKKKEKSKKEEKNGKENKRRKKSRRWRKVAKKQKQTKKMKKELKEKLKIKNANL